MPTNKTEAEILTEEIERLKRRLAKLSMDHLEITGVVIKPQGANLKKCNKDDEEERMVQQSDGSFKLKCVKKL